MQEGIRILKPLIKNKLTVFRLPTLCQQQVGSVGTRKNSWNVATLLSRSEIDTLTHQWSPWYTHRDGFQ